MDRKRWGWAVLAGLLVLAACALTGHAAPLDPLHLSVSLGGLGLMAGITYPGTDPTYNTLVYFQQGGAVLHVISGGQIQVDAGGIVDVPVAANPAVQLGVDGVLRFQGPGATGNVDWVNNLGYPVVVYDATFVKSAVAGGAGDQVIIQNLATAISNAISLNVAAKTIARPTTLDPAQQQIANGGTLRTAWTKATDCTGELVVSTYRPS